MARKQATVVVEKPAPHRPRSLIASAAPVDITSSAQVKRMGERKQPWWTEAWLGYNAIGTIRHALDYRADVIAKIDLFAAVLPVDGDDEPVPAGAASQPTEDEAGNRVDALVSEGEARIAEDTMTRLDDKPRLLRKMSLNLDIPGDTHVIGETRDGTETWRAYSTSELDVKTSGSIYIKAGRTDKRGRRLEPDSLVFRTWIEHPEWTEDSTSHLQPLVEEGIIEELLLVSQEMIAGSKSRATKKLMLVAEEMSLSGSIDDGTAAAELESEEGGDEFAQEVIEWVTSAITDPGSAASVAPNVWRVPAEFIQNKSAVDVFDLGAELSTELIDRARYLLDRIIDALPLPPEIMRGVATANHWGGGVIERMSFRSYIEPTVLAICQALTTNFLRPLMIAAGVAEDVAARFVVWFDPSDAVTEEDRTEVASRGVELGTVSGMAWRRVAKFDESDKPTDDEHLARAALERGTISDALLVALLKGLGFPSVADLPLPPPPAELPAPPLVAAAGRNAGETLSEIDRRLFERVIALSDSAVERSVEKAANRLRSAANRDATAKQLAARVDGPEIGRALGKGVAARVVAAENDDELGAALFNGEFAILADKVDALLAQAQQATVAVALRAGDEEVSEAELVTLAEDQAQDRDLATDLLIAALLALSLRVLFDGRPDPGMGEDDPTVVVPAGLIREVLAVGGGATNIVRTKAGGLLTEGRPVGGVATGERSMQLFARVGAWWTGYRWHYGDAATRAQPFPPHQALSGREFSKWDDPTLTNSETAWLGSISYTPGDHRGCQCSFVPIVLGET